MNPAYRSKVAPHRRLDAALSLFLFFGCAAFAGVGATVAFIDPSRPRVVGATVMIIAVAVAIATVRFWSRVLPAIFACGALNGLLIAINGHALNSPGIPVARPLGLLLTAAMAAGSTMTAATMHRRHTLVQRASFVGIFLSVALLFSSFRLEPVAYVAALCCAGFPAARDLVVEKGGTAAPRHSKRKTSTTAPRH